jgi:hypothetical protein
MYTLTQSRNEPATVQISRGFRIADAMKYWAWIARVAKQQMVLERNLEGYLVASLGPSMSPKARTHSLCQRFSDERETQWTGWWTRLEFRRTRCRSGSSPFFS